MITKTEMRTKDKTELTRILMNLDVLEGVDIDPKKLKGIDVIEKEIVQGDVTVNHFFIIENDLVKEIVSFKNDERVFIPKEAHQKAWGQIKNI